MSLMSFMDRDNDGSSIDDGFTFASGLGAAGLGAVGTLGGAAATGIGGIGTALVGLGAGETATGIGALVGVPTATLGLGMMGAGALLGLGSAGALGGSALLGGAATSGLAEEVGDFTADLTGMRGASPFAGKECTDAQYASGNNDAPGQQLNQFLFGP
jgi:hypothetical protein